eukprot:SAG11_NODE_254_length_11587_cov_4.312913_10_plen_102_part_00
MGEGSIRPGTACNQSQIGLQEDGVAIRLQPFLLIRDYAVVNCCRLHSASEESHRAVQRSGPSGGQACQINHLVLGSHDSRPSQAPSSTIEMRACRKYFFAY